ncbi:MAG TPA: hypothetical protein VGC07_05195 [Granulicella sp.]
MASMPLMACAQSPAQNNSLLARAPRDWIVDAANNEIAILKDNPVHLRYRMHVVDQRGEQLRDVIETKDGTVARVLARGDKPLTAEESKGERDRLTSLMNSPQDYEKHAKNDASSRKMAVDMIKLMPDAMIYTYTPGQPDAGPGEGEGVVVMDYHPNPKWSPPSTLSEALTGLEGRVWIDAKTHTMVRMQGHIFKGVNFGWGMLAHIYPGGQLALEQTHITGNRWIYLHFTEQITVRALMVKMLNLHTQIDASEFAVLPEALTYQEAIRQLLATP